MTTLLPSLTITRLPGSSLTRRPLASTCSLRPFCTSSNRGCAPTGPGGPFLNAAGPPGPGPGGDPGCGENPGPGPLGPCGATPCTGPLGVPGLVMPGGDVG